MQLDSLTAALGSAAPDFSLPSVDGNTFALKDVAGRKATLVAFICNHCPFVVHIIDEFARFARQYQPQGLGIAAISSNDVARYPADSPERMAEFAAAHEFTFPYLYDESQEVAKAYGAVCTPDFFLYDKALKLAYAGRFDGSSPGRPNVPVTGDEMRRAVDAVISGQPAPLPQMPSSGCSMKWKPGNAP